MAAHHHLWSTVPFNATHTHTNTARSTIEQHTPSFHATHSPTPFSQDTTALRTFFLRGNGHHVNMPHRSQTYFFDDDGSAVLVWRPTKAPPVPVSHTSADHTRLSSRAHHDTSAAPPTVGLPFSTALTAPTHEEPGVPAGRSPPRGQLLPRGMSGIDGVLQRARAAQQLHWALQERRLQGEKRASQRRLKMDLDDQRQCKRMLRLAEYQEELVNVFGPTMQNILGDTFFDDGMDPALQVLREQRSVHTTAVPTHSGCSEDGHREQTLAAWRAAREEHRRAGGGDTACVEEELRTLSLPLRTLEPYTSTTHQSREKELLNRALDQYRGGRRMPF